MSQVPEGIEIRVVDDYDSGRFRELVERNLESVGTFVPEWDYRINADPSFKRTGRIVRIGAFAGETLIGISWGESVGKGRFAMQMSLVEEGFRRRGIYTAMLERMLAKTRDFGEIESHHHLHNNAVLVAKLKRGFVIVGFDQSIMIGPRVVLRYYNNKALRAMMEYRVGLRASLETPSTRKA